MHEHFSTPSNILVSLITIFYDFALILFPVYAFILIRDNFSTLSTDNTTNRYGIFYEGMSLKTKLTAIYNVIFMTRRLITALVLVLMYDFPFFQTQLLLVMSAMNVIYMVSFQPLSDKLQNRIEILNEVTILLCCYCLDMFLDIAIPLEGRDIIGWALMFFASLNIVINISIIVSSTFLGMYVSYCKWELSGKHDAFFKKRLANHKYLIDQLPIDLSELKQE